MQLHALDQNGQVVNARRAQRQMNYVCLECRHNVRLRRGPHRQPHFYHSDPVLMCRQHQKGAAHLQLQTYFFNQLPAGDCQLECTFPTLGRIADVAWFSQKIVFEIQCSPISAEEVLSRNRDYQKEGWSVVWILHDRRFNQVRMSAAEIALRSSPHYFSNMDESGAGIIYDQYDLSRHSLRLGRLPPLPIDLKGEISFYQSDQKSSPLLLLQQRASDWPFYFAGDLMSLFLNDLSSDYLMCAQAKEKELLPNLAKVGFSHLLLKIWLTCVKRPYQLIFRFFLERICR